jgi:D-alanyl-D-alanine carboxypeptidase (penicillin-binding protein 5/6)
MLTTENPVIQHPAAAGFPLIVAQRAIGLHPATQRVVYERSPDVQGAVASTQKLLTALVIWREGGLDHPVIIREEDLSCMPYHLGLQPGEQATRRDLLHAILLGSSNDAAMALARDNAGDVDAFADKMNHVARECGMSHSCFTNPHGLPDERQHSTARDVARLACRIDGIPQLRAMVSCREYAVPRADGSSILLRNRNRLLFDDSGCDGMKTGYTRAAGYCLVASGGTGLSRRIAVVLNSTEDAVWSDASALLSGGMTGDEAGFSNEDESASAEAA